MKHPALAAIERAAPELEVLSLLTGDPDVRAPIDADGNTWLHLTVRHNYIHLSGWLMSLGAHPGKGNFRGQTPIDFCTDRAFRRRMFGVRDRMIRAELAGRQTEKPAEGEAAIAGPRL